MSVAQRLVRWIVFSVALAAFTFVVAGRVDLPMLDAFVGVCSAFLLAGLLLADPELSRERWRRGQTGEDPRRLLLLRSLFLVLFVFALLDIGRLHWSDRVPQALQLAGLGLLTFGFAWILWAVHVNRFFVPVIRIQSERGHQVVTTGPYAIVRHPGYAGMTIVPSSVALALGSWGALIPALALTYVFANRAAHEDRFLRANLPGYADYAARVRFRLMPGVW